MRHEDASNRAAGPIALPPVTIDWSASHLSPLACRVAAAALTPSDHSYVPWVVVEGKPLKNSEALVKHVCKKYTGANKPAACAKAEAETVADAASTSSDAACPVAW